MSTLGDRLRDNREREHRLRQLHEHLALLRMLQVQRCTPERNVEIADTTAAIAALEASKVVLPPTCALCANHEPGVCRDFGVGDATDCGAWAPTEGL